MFVAVWKYEVKEESIKKFEDLYGQEGKWVKLFNENAGYLVTEFIKNIYQPYVYITIDKWESRYHYQNYLDKNENKIMEIDAEGEDLTLNEDKIGWFETVNK